MAASSRLPVMLVIAVLQSSVVVKRRGTSLPVESCENCHQRVEVDGEEVVGHWSDEPGMAGRSFAEVYDPFARLMA